MNGAHSGAEMSGAAVLCGLGPLHRATCQNPRQGIQFEKRLYKVYDIDANRLVGLSLPFHARLIMINEGSG